MPPPRRSLNLALALALVACSGLPASPPSDFSPTALRPAAMLVASRTSRPASATPIPASPTSTPTLEPTLTLVPSPTPFPPSPTSAPSPIPPSPTAVVLALSFDGSVEAAEQAVVDLTNFYRAQAGRSLLVADPVLMAIAGERAADMAARGYFGHTDPATGEHLARSRAAAAGFAGPVGENIYWSSRPLAQVPSESVGWFMSEPAHADNTLKAAFVYIGVGIAPGADDTWILAQILAAP